jgi:hypothetical protein
MAAQEKTPPQSTAQIWLYQLSKVKPAQLQRMALLGDEFNS